MNCKCHCHHREAKNCPDNLVHPTFCDHCDGNVYGYGVEDIDIFMPTTID